MRSTGRARNGRNLKSREKQKKKESAKEEFIKRNRGGENYKNVLQITLRLEMIADHKEPVAMETSSLQAML